MADNYLLGNYRVSVSQNVKLPYLRC
jgi:hypothetical protein